jgi:two-component system cell cycle sensor histidine kinase PleC
MSGVSNSGQWTVRSVAVAAPTLDAKRWCCEAFDMLNDNVELAGLAVTQGGLPLGLVSRIPLMTVLARPITHALYERKPVTKLMERQPLIVDGGTSISDVSTLIASMLPDAMINGFIVTENGRYLGIGDGLGLLRRMTEQAEARNRDLADAVRQAMDASAAKSRFLAHMSHELRTPLNAVLGFSEVMQRELFGCLGHAKYREYVEDIHGSASHLLNLINEVLDLSKAEAGKFELDLAATDLAALMRECLRLFTVRLEEAGLTLEADIDPTLPLVLADARKLKQAVINLLSNAVKFTPEGGVVELELTRLESGAFRIAVSDSGIGMSDDEIATALSPFGQVTNSLTRQFPGTGLGLPLANAFVTLHQGSLRVLSASGVGTTIMITLPLALAEATPLEAQAGD